MPPASTDISWLSASEVSCTTSEEPDPQPLNSPANITVKIMLLIAFFIRLLLLFAYFKKPMSKNGIAEPEPRYAD